MRLLLAVLCAALLGGCTGGRKSYPDDVSPKNVSVRPALAGVKGALHIHRMDAQCKTEYLGTVDLDQPSVALGLPAGRASYLVFNFSSSSWLRGSHAMSQETMLTPRAGYRYEIDASYSKDIYNVVVREVPPKGAARELPLRDFSSCPAR